jgi:hypothetical protein
LKSTTHAEGKNHEEKFRSHIAQGDVSQEFSAAFVSFLPCCLLRDAEFCSGKLSSRIADHAGSWRFSQYHYADSYT